MAQKTKINIFTFQEKDLLKQMNLFSSNFKTFECLNSLFLFFIVICVMSAFSQGAMKRKFTEVPLCYENILL